jgi:tetratricopeptide (TPR) repeat protein
MQNVRQVEVNTATGTHGANHSSFRAAPSNNRVTRRLRILFFALSPLFLFGQGAQCQQTQHSAGTTAKPATQSFDSLVASAQAAMEANRAPEAIHLYEKATALRPTWSEGWWYLGTLYFDAGQLSKARDAFLHFVSVEHQQAGPGYGMLGLTEFQLKDYQKSLAALERGLTLGLGDNVDFVHSALYHDGILNNLFGQPEIALVRLTLLANQLAQEHPESPKEAVLSDTALLDAFGLAALHIEKLPDEIPLEKPIRDAGHAQALIALQDRVTAGAELKQLVAAHDSEPGVHYMYAGYLLKEGSPAATGELRREIEISPKHVAARVALAFGYLESADYKQGLEYARQAIALAPNNFAAHIACGRLLVGMEENDEALRELRTAVRLAPGSPDAHFALSRALAQAGQKEEAARERAAFERLKAPSNTSNPP